MWEVFSRISNQTSKKEPDFDLMNQISFAQNNRDLDKLDKIAREIKSRKEKPSFWLQFRLENAYAWVLHSGDQIDPQLRKKLKLS